MRKVLLLALLVLHLLLELLLVGISERIVDSLLVHDLRVVLLVKDLRLHRVLGILRLILLLSALACKLILVLSHLFDSLLLLMLATIVVYPRLQSGLH